MAGGGRGRPGAVGRDSGWGGISGLGPERRPGPVPVSLATYLGSQSVSRVAVQVRFLRNEGFSAAERMESMSGPKRCVAEMACPLPTRGASPPPGALQSQWGCHRGHREMGELQRLVPGAPAGLGVGRPFPPRFDDYFTLPSARECVHRGHTHAVPKPGTALRGLQREAWCQARPHGPHAPALLGGHRRRTPAFPSRVYRCQCRPIRREAVKAQG